MGTRQTDPHEDSEPPRSGHRGISREGAKVYQGVLEAVLCIPAGALLGWAADGYFESGPWGTAVGVAFGFVAFVLNVIQLTKRMSAEAAEKLSAEAAKNLQEESETNDA